ncbi:MAG: lipopolysaccharide heptosyltransferase II [Motiliproteus sp.]|nr:lipopolysaccharide heptosyltransferase II [Motiliproteus sp.]
MSKKWLIIGPSWVGDMVMAQSLFKRLKADQPDCTVDVVAPGWSQPILARMPEVQNAVALDVKHGEFGWGKRFQLGKQLRGRYSHSIVLPRSWKSALLPFVAEVPERIGYRGEMRFGLINDMRLMDKQRLPLAVERYVALGGAISMERPEILQPQLQVDQDNQQRFLEQNNLNLDKPVVALLPGAEFGPAKQWPVEYWAESAEALADKGYQLWCLGSPKDRDVAEQIQTASKAPVENLCGRTELKDAVDILALAKHAITNDSGLMHVAAAVGCHLVAIYRTTTPEYTPPLTENCHILRADLGGDESLKGVRELPVGIKLTDVQPNQVVDNLG